MNDISFSNLEQKIARCKKMLIEEVDINKTDNLLDIKISKNKPSNERILEFLNKASNPYIFEVDGRLVKIEFSDNNKTADACITRVIRSLYR